ncbi:MAG: glutamate--cysteine ligase [Solirubrobacterales bacterium]
MGQQIPTSEFRPEDFELFARRLDASLNTLAELLERPGFGAGEPSIGAEVEFTLVDEEMRPANVNREVLAGLDGHAASDHLSLEVNRFDIELDTPPVPLAGAPLSSLSRSIGAGVEAVGRMASSLGALPALVGTLPTATLADIDPDRAITPTARYHVIDEMFRRLRPDGQIEIDGRERLSVSAPGVSIEGLNSAFQVHLKVAPERFAPTLNAAHLASAPAVAVAGNSPFLLGRSLWEETRIPLFRAVASDSDPGSGRPSRAPLGHGWLRGSPLELFAEQVRVYRTMFPICAEEEGATNVEGTPELPELRLHCGSIWQWNRPVYDPAGGGHIRIELRCLPSGPTVADMVASCAFLLGATLALAERPELPETIAFETAESNFDAAARHGLDAELLWPAHDGARERAAPDVIAELLPEAQRALVSCGVEADEADHWLAICARRLDRGVTGSSWQRARVADAEPELGREGALTRMLAELTAHDVAGAPVVDW